VREGSGLQVEESVASEEMVFLVTE